MARNLNLDGLDIEQELETALSDIDGHAFCTKATAALGQRVLQDGRIVEVQLVVTANRADFIEID